MVEKYFVIFKQKWKGNYSPIFRMFRIAAIWKLLSENIHDSFFIFKIYPFLSLRFGEMTEKYFIIFRQKWNKGQSFFHLSNWSNLEFLLSRNIRDSSYTVWRMNQNGRKVLYNFQAEMKQKAIILPFFERFESEQFGACYRKMLFLYFSSPFYTVYRMENDRKVLDNFQACAEMKHGTSSWYAIGRLSSGSCTPSLAREKSSRWFTMPLERVCFSWPTSSRLGPRSIIRRSTEIV